MNARPTLADVLALDDEHALGALVASPRRYLTQAQAATPDEKRRILELLAAVWPVEGLRANIRRKGDQWTLDHRVHAILTLGPAVDLPLESDRWAQVATSGLAFGDQTDWLHRHYSREAVSLAARSEATDVRTWDQIMAAVPDSTELPDELVAAMVAKMRTFERDDDVLFLRHMGDRLAESRYAEALRSLIDVDERFAAPLRPALAKSGDVSAAKALLDVLATHLAAGRSSDYLELEWLTGVRDPLLLEPLFSCLEAALKSENARPLGPVPSLVSAIRRLGGVAAVHRYDVLIASSDESAFKFMHHSRDDVVEDLLKVVGQEAAPAAAAALGLPHLADAE